MAAYAALVSLMNNIEQIQRHTRLPIHFDQKQSESLIEKVSFLINFLESYKSHEEHEEMKILESRISNAAYLAEDIIETHVVDTINSHSRSICIPRKRDNKIMAHFRYIFTQKKNTIITGQTENSSSCLSGIEKVMEEMDIIKDEAMKINDRKETGDLQVDAAPLSSSIPVGMSTMVGFDDELIELLERLTGHQSSRQVIPIVGMGGMGKTTLAKNAYEKPLIMHYFDCRAWVSISQQYSLRQILLGLLGQESSQMGDEQLGESLYKSLFGRRYLVVLDDMWSVEAWEMVRVFLPDNNNGSRIVVTTRISSVATHLDSCGLEMNFLNGDKSWTLFCEKVFGQEGCPIELEEVGRRIVKNCKGLPLSIVVIGGLLANSEKREEYWEYVARDTKSIVSLEANEMCTKLLHLSYHNLPIHLKPCFLYMGVFPEDEEILVSMLIKLWVAEGFIKPNSPKELEAIAEEYLNDLISRNLILVHRRGVIGKLKYCMIHDLLRDVCLKEAQRDKFLHVLKIRSNDEVKRIGSQRRISILPNLSAYEYIPRALDTLKSGSMVRSLIFDVYDVSSLPNCRLLRIFKVVEKPYNNDAKFLLDEVFQLVNSRFIAFNPIWNSQFPSSFRLLWNLQILIVRGTAGSGTAFAPFDIWEMTELRHLQFERILYLPEPRVQQTNAKGDVTMHNLQTLKNIADFRCSDEVVKRIPNIKRLKISYEVTEIKECYLRNIGLLEKLESLTCSFPYTRRIPDLSLNLGLPSSLRKLTLSRSKLRWEDMAVIGSLPHLQVLKLLWDAFTGPEWVTNEEEFCCLKYLKIHYCKGLVHWIADETHFPCLEHLDLHSMDKLVEIPSGIGDIDSLQSVQLSSCRKSAIISAKRILEEQEELGNDGLQVRVYCNWSSELENLPSDNFLIFSYT